MVYADLQNHWTMVYLVDTGAGARFAAILAISGNPHAAWVCRHSLLILIAVVLLVLTSLVFMMQLK